MHIVWSHEARAKILRAVVDPRLRRSMERTYFTREGYDL